MKNLVLFTIIAFLSLHVFSQDFENTKDKLENPVAGMYQPSYATMGYPYTTIYKPFRENSIDTFIEDLRLKIALRQFTKVDQYYNLYNSIYTDAQKTYSSNDLSGKNEGVAPNSYYAKHAAFVYLMGFNQYGRVLRGTGDPHDQDTLMFFRTTALERLYNLDYEVGKAEKIQYRVKEMVHYLQAYDYLKAAGVQSNSLEDAKYSLIKNS